MGQIPKPLYGNLEIFGLSCSHEGPVWQVAWAHPMYGNILASCSYDRKVIIWKEENGTWEKTYEYTGHDSSGMTWSSGKGPIKKC